MGEIPDWTESAVRRGLRDSRQHRKPILVTALSAGVALFLVLWWFGDGPDSVGDEVRSAWVSVATSAVLGVLATLWHIARAPVKQRDEARDAYLSSRKPPEAQHALEIMRSAYLKYGTWSMSWERLFQMHSLDLILNEVGIEEIVRSVISLAELGQLQEQLARDETSIMLAAWVHIGVVQCDGPGRIRMTALGRDVVQLGGTGTS